MRLADMTAEDRDQYDSVRADVKQENDALAVLRDAQAAQRAARLADVPSSATVAQLRLALQGLIEEMRGD